MSVSIFGLCPNLWTLLNVNDRPHPKLLFRDIFEPIGICKCIVCSVSFSFYVICIQGNLILKNVLRISWLVSILKFTWRDGRKLWNPILHNNLTNALCMLTPLYSRYTMLHVLALKGPSSESTGTNCE